MSVFRDRRIRRRCAQSYFLRMHSRRFLFSVYAFFQSCPNRVQMLRFALIDPRQVAFSAELRAGDGRADEGSRRRSPPHQHDAVVRRRLQRQTTAARQPSGQDRPSTSFSASDATSCNDAYTETGEQVYRHLSFVVCITDQHTVSQKTTLMFHTITSTPIN